MTKRDLLVLLFSSILLAIGIFFFLGIRIQPTVEAQHVSQDGVINVIPIGNGVELIQINITQPGFVRDTRCFVVHNTNPNIAGNISWSAPSCVN